MTKQVSKLGERRIEYLPHQPPLLYMKVRLQHGGLCWLEMEMLTEFRDFKDVYGYLPSYASHALLSGC